MAWPYTCKCGGPLRTTTIQGYPGRLWSKCGACGACGDLDAFDSSQYLAARDNRIMELEAVLREIVDNLQANGRVVTTVGEAGRIYRQPWWEVQVREKDLRRWEALIGIEPIPQVHSNNYGDLLESIQEKITKELAIPPHLLQPKDLDKSCEAGLDILKRMVDKSESPTDPILARPPKFTMISTKCFYEFLLGIYKSLPKLQCAIMRRSWVPPLDEFFCIKPSNWSDISPYELQGYDKESIVVSDDWKTIDCTRLPLEIPTEGLYLVTFDEEGRIVYWIRTPYRLGGNTLNISFGLSDV